MPQCNAKPTVDDLIPAVYQDLRRLAARFLSLERPGHTLRATALVHEAYLRLAGAQGEWRNRAAFCAAAAHAMRRVLVDYARGRSRQKRGCGAIKVSIDEAAQVLGDPPNLLELDEVLERLAGIDFRKSRIIELLFFGGLTYEECADVLAISPATLHRELRLAKAWLYQELKHDPEHASRR
jgi:RNA polymerase sigma factor (TIGR02999 family)